MRHLHLHHMVLSAGLLVALTASDAAARRDYLTAEQKERLERVKTVLIETVALTAQGPKSPEPLTEVVRRRMHEVGYEVVTDPSAPHDVTVRVKCEERKTWEGTTASGGDADLPDSPSRVWSGPACQLTYLLDGRRMGWQKEVRTDFADAVQAAAAAQAGDPGDYAMAKLKERLEAYDFPVLLSAEWGQEKRLLGLLDAPGTTQARKLKIISLFGEIFATEAVPRLIAALKDQDLVVAASAAVALGNIGRKDAVVALIDVLKTGPPELQAAAAKGLGHLGALHGDFTIVPPLLEALDHPDIRVKIEAAWALGKLPDRRAYQPLYGLAKQLAGVRGPDADPDQKKLREAVHWSLKQVEGSAEYRDSRLGPPGRLALDVRPA